MSPHKKKKKKTDCYVNRVLKKILKKRVFIEKYLLQLGEIEGQREDIALYLLV